MVPLMLMLISSITVITGPLDVSVSGNVNEGCVAILYGQVNEFVVYGGNRVKVLEDFYCSKDPFYFKINVSGLLVAFSLPETNVVVGGFPRPYEVKVVGDKTLVVVDPPIILVGVVVILVFFIVLLKRRYSSSDDYSVLLSYVAENPGSAQKQIAKALGMPEYKVSRMLSKLEKDGVIVRIRRGMSKRVYLAEQLRKVAR